MRNLCDRIPDRERGGDTVGDNDDPEKHRASEVSFRSAQGPRHHWISTQTFN